jgi:hypothetical protein
MNQLTTLPAPTMGPQSMVWPMQATERMQLCRELATARLVPPAFQKSPADIFLAMNTIERLGLDFFLTIGECYVVQGKIGFSGKLAAAIINSCGQLSERLSYEYEGAGDDRTITVRGRLQGEGEAREIKVRLGDAKTRNENWTKQPDQMLGYAGARTWGRRHLSEVLLGMRFDDEIEIEAPPRDKPKRAAPPEIVVPQATAPEQSTETQATATEPYPLASPDDIDDSDPDQWRSWCADFVALVRTAKTLEQVGGWLAENKDLLEVVRELAPKMHGNLEHAVETHRQAIKEAKPKKGAT